MYFGRFLFVHCLRFLTRFSRLLTLQEKGELKAYLNSQSDILSKFKIKIRINHHHHDPTKIKIKTYKNPV